MDVGEVVEACEVDVELGAGFWSVAPMQEAYVAQRPEQSLLTAGLNCLNRASERAPACSTEAQVCPVTAVYQ